MFIQFWLKSDGKKIKERDIIFWKGIDEKLDKNQKTILQN